MYELQNGLKMTLKPTNNDRFLKHKLWAFQWYISCKSILRGGVNIFAEIRKFRGSSRAVSSRIDDEIGADNIACHFAGIYSQLYNRADNGQALDDAHHHILQGVDQGGLAQVDRINKELVSKALKMMKTGKNDALFDFQSDCLVNGPQELLDHITNLLKKCLD